MRNLILCGLLLAGAAHSQTIQPDQFAAWIRSSPAPGVYTLAPGVHRATDDRAKPLFLRDGGFEGAEDTPLVIQGAGAGQTIIECPEVCYFSRSEYVTWKGLTIRGYVNTDHARYWRFLGVTLDDPNGIGPTVPNGSRPGILFKAASRDGLNDPDPGSGPITFEGGRFDPVVDGTDTTLDFVGTQGVKILHSTFERCNRGCLQAKGGAGVIEGYEIAYNLIKDAGQRGIMVGGSTDPGRYDPLTTEAKAEFGSADIHDNVILGGNACAVFSTTAGPVRFHHNLCRGASAFQIRMLVESEFPPFYEAGGLRGLQIDHNVFADWGGRWDNVITGMAQIGERWGAASNETISVEHNLFNHWTGQRSWPLRWKQGGNIQVVPGALTFSEDGRSLIDAVGVDNWQDYGPRPEVEPPPIDERLDGAMAFLVVMPDGRVLFYPDAESAAEAAKNGGTVAKLKISGASE